MVRQPPLARATENCKIAAAANLVSRAPKLTASEVERLGHFKVVLTDFERTLVRLFQDSDVEKEFFNEVWSLCRRFDIPTRVLKAAGESPYSLWTKAYHWMTWSRRNPLHAEWMYHAATSIATKYEKHAAESVRLFDDVRPVLEQLRTADIPVVIVSNNATEAVQWILEKTTPTAWSRISSAASSNTNSLAT